ncbi:MAG: cupin domain-containing protein [Methanomassiliicoccales archaeon]
MPLRIKNVLETEHKKERSHGGEGLLEKVRIFENNDFQTSLAFIDYVIVPPGASIGYHKHGNDEEVYFIVEGNGIMKDENSEVKVKRGDVVVNPVNGSHGLYNNSNDNIIILVFEVANGRDKHQFSP